MIRRENVWVRRAGLLAAAVLLLAGNIAFLLWQRATTPDRERSLEGRRVTLEKEVAAAEAEALRLSVQRDRLSRVSSAITDFYENRIGPRREALAPIVDEIHTVLRRIGVNPPQISYSATSLPDLGLTEMTVTLSFRNDYAKFKQLLAAFESDRRWIVVRDVGLTRDADIPGGVQVHMGLATYFAGEEKTERASPKPAASRAAAVR